MAEADAKTKKRKKRVVVDVATATRPNLFLIGAPKAGTSALAEALAQHPAVFLPRLKEPRYFDARVYYDYPEDYPRRDLADYLGFYAEPEAATATYRLDASTFNMYSRDSINDILSVSPDAKFLISLRDPLSAAKSMQAQRLKYIDLDLREISDEFCRCWQLSLKRREGARHVFPRRCRRRFLFRYDLLFDYERYVPAIVDLVGAERLHILRYEALRDEPVAELRAIAQFLGLAWPEPPVPGRVNESYVVRPSLRDRLVCTIANLSIGPAARLGYSGKDIQKVKRRWLQRDPPRSAIVPDKPTRCDDEVRAFFRRTYAFLQEIDRGQWRPGARNG